MKIPFPLLAVAAAALMTLPGAVQAGETATCPASKSDTAASTCCASKGNYVMLKLKGGDAGAISQSLAKLDGVQAADTCCQSKFTKISYDKDKVCAAKILAAVKSAGYKVQAQRVTYAVEGMSCGSCAEKISKSLSKLRGVSDAKVCTESKQATIDFNPGRISEEKILAAMDASGFKASAVMN